MKVIQGFISVDSSGVTRFLEHVPNILRVKRIYRAEKYNHWGVQWVPDVRDKFKLILRKGGKPQKFLHIAPGECDKVNLEIAVDRMPFKILSKEKAVIHGYIGVDESGLVSYYYDKPEKIIENGKIRWIMPDIGYCGVLREAQKTPSRYLGVSPGKFGKIALIFTKIKI